MKKLVAIFAFVASAVSVGLGAVSDAEFKEIQSKCYDKYELNSCERLCDLKDGDGCGALAAAFYGGEENYPKVFHYAQIACGLESALGCLFLGSFYAEGKGVAKDTEKGYDLMGEALCGLKLNMPAEFFNEIMVMKPNEVCYELGVQYHNGQKVSQDYSKAAHYYQIACEAKNADACNNLGALYAEGQGARLDFIKASQHYKTACDLKNAYGCYNLGMLYYGGKGVKANKNKAKEFFGKACDLGFQDGCDNYKEMVNSSPKRGL